jgi:hypothetical protein
MPANTGRPALEQLIVAAGPYPGQVLAGVDPPRLDHRLRNDAMHHAQGDRLIQQILEKRDHPPKRAVSSGAGD